MTETEKEMVAAVRRHAEANYEKHGWDFLVECWSDEEIAETIAGASSEAAAIARCKAVVKTLDGHRREQMAMARW